MNKTFNTFSAGSNLKKREVHFGGFQNREQDAGQVLLGSQRGQYAGESVLGPAASGLADVDAIEVLEHVVERYPESAILRPFGHQQVAELRCPNVGVIGPIAGPNVMT